MVSQCPGRFSIHASGSWVSNLLFLCVKWLSLYLNFYFTSFSNGWCLKLCSVIKCPKRLLALDVSKCVCMCACVYSIICSLLKREAADWKLESQTFSCRRILKYCFIYFEQVTLDNGTDSKMTCTIFLKFKLTSNDWGISYIKIWFYDFSWKSNLATLVQISYYVSNKSYLFLVDLLACQTSPHPPLPSPHHWQLNSHLNPWLADWVVSGEDLGMGVGAATRESLCAATKTKRSQK